MYIISYTLKSASDYRKKIYFLGITYELTGNSNIMEDENGISSIKKQGFNLKLANLAFLVFHCPCIIYLL